MNASPFLFILLALALTFGVSGVLLWALLRTPTSPTINDLAQTQTQANANVYRDQIADLQSDHDQGSLSAAEFAHAKDELTRRLLEDTALVPPSAPGTAKRSVTLAVSLAAALPVLGLLGYWAWGNPQALNPPTVAQADPSLPDMATLADKLAQKLKTEPNNVQGWTMLGRTYRELGRAEDALAAYDHALALQPNDDLLLERTETLAAKNGGSFAGEPWKVIRAVLAKNPKHFNGLLLAGSASFVEHDYAAATQLWEQARTQLTPNDPEAQGLDNAIAKAREAMGQGTAPAAPDASASANISGQVRLDAALQSKAAPQDTVFVYATATQGPPMPLAILRTTVAQLPLNFKLDDSLAMSPQSKLSSHQEVIVKARISKSGNAMTQPGDLTGTLGKVKVGAQQVQLTIDQEVK